MTQLGSVFEPDSGQARGPDLTASVQVPRAALGLADGIEVEVPLTLEREGEHLARTPSPHDEGAFVHLFLPESFPDGGTLRLRGQGAPGPGGRPGDLLLQIRLNDDPLPPAEGTGSGSGVALWWILAVVGAGGGLWLAFGAS